MLTVGYANPIIKEVPAGLNVVVEPGAGDITNKIQCGPAPTSRPSVSSPIARNRRVRKPEPYKGKGVK